MMSTTMASKGVLRARINPSSPSAQWSTAKPLCLRPLTTNEAILRSSSTTRMRMSGGIIQVHSLYARIKIDGTRPLFLERVGAGFFDATERRLQCEAGGDLIDLHH